MDPVATVLSGDPQVLRELLTTFEEQKIFWRSTRANGAGHSPQMDPLLEEVRACLHGIKPQMGHSSVEVTEEYLKVFNLRAARQNQEKFSAVSTLDLLNKRKRKNAQ